MASKSDPIIDSVGIWDRRLCKEDDVLIDRETGPKQVVLFLAMNVSDSCSVLIWR